MRSRWLAGAWAPAASPVKTCQRALELAEQTANRREAAHALGLLGLLHVSVPLPGLRAAERIRQGRAFLAEAVATARGLGDRAHVNSSLNLLGNAHWYLGEYRDARDTFEENLALVEAIGARSARKGFARLPRPGPFA